MAGGMWFPFRQGNRSEYLALYILSALGICISVPRQEDIGIDFYCSLAKNEGKRMTFYSPFVVQVKSSSEKEISYGGPDKKKRWKKEEIEWLFNQELPLLIAIVDKENLIMKLYATSNMWAARYTGGDVGQVVLQPDKLSKDNDVPMPQSISVSDWPAGVGDGKKWLVPLGPPILSISINDVENEAKIDEYKRMLSFPLYMEQENITYRRLQVHCSKWPHRFTTNKPEKFVYGLCYAANPTPGANTSEQLKSLAPIIATLAFNYKSQGKSLEIESLKPIVKLIPSSRELRVLRDKVPELFE
jgi:hypothetical protein